MMHFLFPAIAVFIAVSSALPATSSYNHVVHEKRNSAPAKWTKRSRIDPSAVLPVRVGLSQRNMHRAHEYLDSVSNPTSKNYGKHWSVGDVTKTFAPSDESRNAVLLWLSQNGISSVKDEGALHALEFDLPVADAEKLLNTQYFVYQHDESGQAYVACEEYSVPAHITKHINIITPTLHFDIKPQHHMSKRDLPNPADPVTGYHPFHEEFKGAAPTAQAGNITSLQDCLAAITPDCLRLLYNIPQATKTPSGENSFGVVEYNPNTYVPEDLDLFFKQFEPSAVGARPDLITANNGSLNFSDPSDFNLHGESNLDLEFAMALVYPQNITLYQVGENDMTDADANFIKTKVVSTSWGFNENDLTPKYMETLCNEYMKLGLQGVSILFSTADNGVAGNTETCMKNRFQPDFPATCPYVTAVGATQLNNATTLSGAPGSVAQPEVAINSQVKSGGGFSDVFGIADYQKEVVQGYLKNSPPPYGADVFNNSGTSRAIPDISANGHGYAVFVGGTQQSVDGTSASTPVFASMITLMNQERVAKGKSSLGFLNPVLYQYADKYVRDVTEGNNPGCNTTGFQAAQGWDPVTGLGTPDYKKLLDVFMGLG